MSTHQQLVEQLYDALTNLKRIILRSREQLFNDLQLTRTQVEVIAFLGNKDNQTIGELAASLSVTHSASTQTIESLVRRGLVERAMDTTDRRIVRARLTVEGHDLAARLIRGRMERLKAVISDLGDEELRVMITVLERLNQQYEQAGTVQASIDKEVK